MNRRPYIIGIALAAVFAAAGVWAASQSPNYSEGGGAVWHVGGDLDIESGGEIDLESGSNIDVESGATLKIAGTTVSPSAAEINVLDNVYSSSSTAVTDGSESANAHNVSLTVKNADGTTLTSAGCSVAHYSSTAVVITYVAPTQATATTGALASLGTGVYSLCWNASGAFVANFYEDGGDADRWLAVQLPTGKLLFSEKLDFD